uniref:Ciliosis and planar polarity effector complex subunit 1 n=1 Tax=Latimeria chalumnae TaxID=7897 RepID=H3AN04_LATCH
MELKLEVLASISIKHKKPWPRVCWLGKEKERVFLLGDKHMSEINLLSGRTKKKAPKLQSQLKNAIAITTSRNGAWLAGILHSGDLFLWNKDRDCLKIVPAAEEAKKVATATQECTVNIYLFVSGDGKRVLFTTSPGHIFLWESADNEDLTSVSYPSLVGKWSQIVPDESVKLPSTLDKEAAVEAVFSKDETLGDCCLCSFVFTSGACLILTFLAVQWYENAEKYISSVSFQVKWATQECSLTTLFPRCEPIKSRGAVVTAFSEDGLILAVAINQKDPKATQVLFVNSLNFVTVSSSLKGCGSKDLKIPLKFTRSYWVADMSWTHDNLFLACVLKRGALLFVTRLGELLTLVTFGCSVEFGPAEFIPLHPLITYRPQQSVFQSTDPNHSPGSSASENDSMRQRYSVTTHPRFPYLLVSDGYMITALRASDNHSPSNFIKSLLLDAVERLEHMRQAFLKCQPKEKKLKLKSMSSLKDSLMQHQVNPKSTLPTIPRFLQEEEEASQERGNFKHCNEDESDDGCHFPNDIPTSQSKKQNSPFDMMDQCRLEFASMFDTIHAKEDPDEADDFSKEFKQIQKILLTAWSTGILLKDVEEKEKLLNYTVRCIVRFAHLLQFIKCPLPMFVENLSDKTLKKLVKKDSWIYRVLHLFHQCLTVLFWDTAHKQSLTRIVKLTSEITKLIFLQQKDQLFSQTLLGCFYILNQTAHYLNIIYAPHCELFPVSPSSCEAITLDSFNIPLFQPVEDNIQKLSSLLLLPCHAVNLAQTVSVRLTILWQVLYRRTLWYQSHLGRQKNLHGRNSEDEKSRSEQSTVALLCSRIQAVLQSKRQNLEPNKTLNTVLGEELFLLGSYMESVKVWRTALQKEIGKGGKRTVFLQTRYYLAILYSHLYHYNLCAAQGLCDQLVREVLNRPQLSAEDVQNSVVAECPRLEPLTEREIYNEVSFAVVQSMARFMAAYFTNQPLYVLPPHCVDILPSLYVKPDHLPRVVPLQHSRMASVVRDQQLSALWTVEYAMDLFLIGGLVPEATWLAHRLGDWKTAVSLGLAYSLYCQNNSYFSSLRWRELHLPLELRPAQVFQDKLQSILGQPAKSGIGNGEISNCKHFIDFIEEEDVDLLFSSIQEILKAAVMADADILSETFEVWMECAKNLSTRLSALVPEGLYLPAPPLYCPQPASVSESGACDQAQNSERISRQKISGVLQRVVLLFRASRCSIPSAHWYIRKLKHIRKIMNKIHLKESIHSLSPFPESLLKYTKAGQGFFKPGPSGDMTLDKVSTAIIVCFRELCALCWMFHVRESLSDSCRRYCIARDNIRKPQDFEKPVEYDACMVEHCISALEWACRLLPFSRFLNVEEVVQDMILSLIAELPPTKKVAEILVKAFSDIENVRVPLRDKYHSLLQRLRHTVVKGPTGEDMMSVVIHNYQKQRSKTLRRVARNIGPLECHIWEPAEEGTAENDLHIYDRFSLGTSVSRSTLTDLGKPQVYSDGETADTISEALLAEESRNPSELYQRYQSQTIQIISVISTTNRLKIKNKKWLANVKSIEKGTESHTLPVVGTWEFECDDDEYVRFLELFFSYLLEKELVNNIDPNIPLLTSFSDHLKEHELNSLLFDVQTTLKRRQNKTTGVNNNFFRAGSCYCTTSVSDQAEKPASLYNEVPRRLVDQDQLNSAVVSNLPRTDSYIDQHLPGVNNPGKLKGLFGSKQQSMSPFQERGQEIPPTPRTFSALSQSFSDVLSSPCPYQIDKEGVIPAEDLTPELKAKFKGTARLLEWMIRWSEKRLHYGPSKVERLQEYNTVIRVKTSAAAILTSLWLLDRRYCKELPHANSNFRAMLKLVDKECPETRQKVDRESSVDTGYPGSAGTPVGAVDPEAFKYSSQNIINRISSDTVDHEEKDVEDDYYPQCLRNREHPSEMDDNTEQEGALLEEAVDFSQGISGYNEIVGPPVQTIKSSSISVSIKHIPRSKETEFWYIVQCKAQNPHLMRNKEQASMERKNLLLADGRWGESLPCTSRKQLSLQLSMLLYSVYHSNQATVNPQCFPGVTTSSAPTVAAGSGQRESQDAEPVSPPLNTSEVVRQMFQDEMFRLVQLQQINFMSLMQVVGLSLANLPNMQLSQNGQMAGGLSLNQNARNNKPQEQSNKENLAEHYFFKEHNLVSVFIKETFSSPRNLFTISIGVNSTGLIKNNPPELALHLHSPGGQSDIPVVNPASRGLIATAPTKCLPLIMPSPNLRPVPTLVPTDKRLSTVNGLPLLKLQHLHQFKPINVPLGRMVISPPQVSFQLPSQPREVWGPSSQSQHLPRPQREKSAPPTHLNLAEYNPEVLQKEERRRAEPTTEDPPKHLKLDQYNNQPSSVGLQHRNDEKHEESVPDLQPSLSYRPHFYSTGIPLLHLQHGLSQPLQRPFVPLGLPQVAIIPPVTKPKTTVNSSLARPPAPSTEYPRIPLLKTNLPPNNFNQCNPPKLIPVQHLIAFEQKHHRSLGGHPEQIQLLRAVIEPFEPRVEQNAKKRQKRRVEKKLEEEMKKKKGPSVNVTFCPEDSIINPDTLDGIAPTEERKVWQYCTTRGSFDFILKEQDSVLGPAPTSAEMHLFASTLKKPAERQDACTNTEPERCVPASVPQVVPPDVFLNLRFPEEVKEPLPTQTSNATSKQNLPSAVAPEVVAASDHDSSHRLSPSTAELHFMAASVTNSVPPEQFQERGKITWVMAFRGQWSAQINREAQLTWKQLKGPLNASGIPCASGKQLSKTQFAAKLNEMDAQLSALQNLAENMELDFADTRLMLTHLDYCMDCDKVNFSKKTNTATLLHIISKFVLEIYLDEEDELLKSPVITPPVLQNRSIFPSASTLSITSDMTNSLTEYTGPGIANSCNKTRKDSKEDALQLTGLSDVADIIIELFKDGKASATELGLSETQAKKISRLLRFKGSSPKRTEKERKEIQEWMKRKRRQRMSEFLKKRSELVESEHSPFKSKKLEGSLTANEIRLNKKIKMEKDKLLLSKHHDRRILQAVDLMNEMLTETVQLPTADLQPLSETSSKLTHRSRRQLLGSARGLPYHKHQFALQSLLSTSRSHVPSHTQRRLSVNPSNGMAWPCGVCLLLILTSVYGGYFFALLITAATTDTLQKTYTYKVFHGNPLQGPGPYNKISRMKEDSTDVQSERELLSPWSPPDDIKRILEKDDTLLQQDPLFCEDNDPRFGIANLDGMDNLSESTGSILSKLDWNDIENMLAS